MATSKPDASKASKKLKDPKATPAEKSAAGSAMSKKKGTTAGKKK